MGALLDAAVDAIMSMDERGAILAFNPAAERMFGYAAEEVIGQNVKILMPSPFREEHDGYIARYLATGEARVIGITREVVALRKDGTVFPVELSVAEARLGDRRVFMGIHRDISERKRAEEKFRLTVEAAPYAMVMVDHHGEIVLVNLQTEKLFGYTRHELLGQPVEVLVPERFRAKQPHYRGEFLANPEARSLGIGHELHARRKDGSEFPVEIGLNPIKTDEGPLVLSAVVDITERKRAEEARRQSEGSLREQAGVLEHAQVLVRGLGDRIILWSQGAARLYGWSREEALGRVSHDLLRTTFPDPLDVIRAELERQGEWEGELVHRGKDGAAITVASHWILRRDEGGVPQAVLEVDIDITDRKRAEEALQGSNQNLEKALAEVQAKSDEVKAMTQQLWQAAKLASVGELAAGIAHELNNPLATVSLRIESVLTRTPADDPRRRALEIIEQETKRMGNLVSDLLQFSRRGREEVSTVDVRQELVKAIELIHHHLRKRLITVVRELAPDTPTIFADRQKLLQVFLNLLANAGDAMPQGGTLILRTAPASLESDAPAVRIEFSDTGGGIPAENLEKVMDHFFTTKEEGQGTGLGLAICRRIVQEHHGTIQMLSEVGKGTTVRIVLPVENGPNVKALRGTGLAE